MDHRVKKLCLIYKHNINIRPLWFLFVSVHLTKFNGIYHVLCKVPQTLAHVNMRDICFNGWFNLSAQWCIIVVCPMQMVCHRMIWLYCTVMHSNHIRCVIYSDRREIGEEEWQTRFTSLLALLREYAKRECHSRTYKFWFNNNHLEHLLHSSPFRFKHISYKINIITAVSLT